MTSGNREMKNAKKKPNAKNDQKDIELQKLNDDRMSIVNGGYTPGAYQAESLAFLKERMGKEQFNRVLNAGNNLSHPYVAARVFLNASDWGKYKWIEQHGSLEGWKEDFI